MPEENRVSQFPAGDDSSVAPIPVPSDTAAATTAALNNIPSPDSVSSAEPKQEGDDEEGDQEAEIGASGKSRLSNSDTAKDTLSTAAGDVKNDNTSSDNHNNNNSNDNNDKSVPVVPSQEAKGTNATLSSTAQSEPQQRDQIGQLPLDEPQSETGPQINEKSLPAEQQDAEYVYEDEDDDDEDDDSDEEYVDDLELQWQESMNQLKGLLSFVILPLVGRMVGRKVANLSMFDSFFFFFYYYSLLQSTFSLAMRLLKPLAVLFYRLFINCQ